MAFIVIVWARDARRAREIRDSYTDSDVGRVAGVYRFPRADEPTCLGDCTRERSAGWGRHRDGHMVHGACQRRHRDYRKRIAVALLDLFGKNMLRNPPSVFRSPLDLPTSTTRD